MRWQVQRFLPISGVDSSGTAYLGCRELPVTRPRVSAQGSKSHSTSSSTRMKPVNESFSMQGSLAPKCRPRRRDPCPTESKGPNGVGVSTHALPTRPQHVWAPCQPKLHLVGPDLLRPRIENTTVSVIMVVAQLVGGGVSSHPAGRRPGRIVMSAGTHEKRTWLCRHDDDRDRRKCRGLRTHHLQPVRFETRTDAGNAPPSSAVNTARSSIRRRDR